VPLQAAAGGEAEREAPEDGQDDEHPSWASG
jgi:hypothetical protein